MKVGLVIYGSLDTISGGYLYDRKLVEHLRAHGDEVSVVTLPWRSYLRHLSDNLSPALESRLRALDVDVMLQDELNHPSLFYTNRRMRRRRPYPVLSIVHHLRSSEAFPQWQRRFYGWVERGYLASVDGLIINSQTTRRSLVELSGAARRLPSIVAYPAGDRFDPHIEVDEIHRRAMDGGALRIVFIGNLIERKGLHSLIAALAMLPREAWRLQVVGRTDVDNRYAQRIIRQVKAESLQQQVKFLGALEAQALADTIRRSHVLAVPSSYEGYGIVYLEGMGFGLPVIGGTQGAAKEIITHGQDGFLVPPGEAQPLAECVSQLAQDRVRLAIMGLAARQRYLAHPTWEQSMSAIRTFLQKTVEG